MIYNLNCVLPNTNADALKCSVSVFGDMAFKEPINVNKVISVGTQSNKTGVFFKKRKRHNTARVQRGAGQATQ